MTPLPPNMQPKEPPRGRPVDQPFREVIHWEWVRRFPWWERLLIVVGHPLVVHIGVATRHKVGEFQPICIGKLSRYGTPDAHMQEVCRNMIETKEKEKK